METDRSAHSLHQATHRHETLSQNLVAHTRNHTSHHTRAAQLKCLETRLITATQAWQDWPSRNTQRVVDRIEQQIRQTSCASTTNTL